MDNITLTCPNCSATLECGREDNYVLCPYCDSKLYVPELILQESGLTPLQQTVTELSRLWSNSEEMYKIWATYYELCQLTSEPELEVLKERFKEYEHNQEKLQRRVKFFKRAFWIANIVICLLCMMDIELVSNSFQQFHMCIVLVGFATVIVSLILWTCSRMKVTSYKSGEAPESQAITTVINSLLSKAGCSIPSTVVSEPKEKVLTAKEEDLLQELTDIIEHIENRSKL